MEFVISWILKCTSEGDKLKEVFASSQVLDATETTIDVIVEVGLFIMRKFEDV